MIRSPLAENLWIHWKGYLHPEKIVLELVPTSLEVPETLMQKVQTAWTEVLKRNPHNYDGQLWRTEGVVPEWDSILVQVSPTRYSIHNVLRHEKFSNFSSYPNPFSISSLQETEDGYLLIGVRGKTSDQKGLHTLGAGFVKRYDSIANKEDASSFLPEPLTNTVLRECTEETAYRNGSTPNRRRVRAITLASGSNRDTTTGVFVPLSAEKKDIDLGNQEHSDIIFLPNSLPKIRKLLADGGYRGIKASGQMLAILDAYALNREERHIVPAYVHK